MFLQGIITFAFLLEGKYGLTFYQTSELPTNHMGLFSSYSLEFSGQYNNATNSTGCSLDLEYTTPL